LRSAQVSAVVDMRASRLLTRRRTTRREGGNAEDSAGRWTGSARRGGRQGGGAVTREGPDERWARTPRSHAARRTPGTGRTGGVQDLRRTTAYSDRRQQKRSRRYERARGSVNGFSRRGAGRAPRRRGT